MKTILIVEDNIYHARLMQKMLNDVYSLVMAVTGQQAIELAETCQPELILLDLHLPDIKGEDVMLAFRQNAKLQNVPIIAVTADAMNGDRDRILNLGFDGYMAKPISRYEFKNTIENKLTQPSDTHTSAS